MWVFLPILSPDLRVDTIFPSTRSVCDVNDGFHILERIEHLVGTQQGDSDVQLNKNQRQYA